jgi:hypothetical protein
MEAAMKPKLLIILLAALSLSSAAQSEDKSMYIREKDWNSVTKQQRDNIEKKAKEMSQDIKIIQKNVSTPEHQFSPKTDIGSKTDGAGQWEECCLTGECKDRCGGGVFAH